jgi:hypothetical protein
MPAGAAIALRPGLSRFAVMAGGCRQPPAGEAACSRAPSSSASTAITARPGSGSATKAAIRCAGHGACPAAKGSTRAAVARSRSVARTRRGGQAQPRWHSAMPPAAGHPYSGQPARYGTSPRGISPRRLHANGVQRADAPGRLSPPKLAVSRQPLLRWEGVNARQWADAGRLASRTRPVRRLVRLRHASNQPCVHRS